MAFRTDHGDNLDKIPQKAKTRVLGRLDVLAGQIVIEECAQCEKPGVSSSVADPIVLKVMSLKDCATIARYDLFLNLHNHCGGEAPDAADLEALEEVFSEPSQAAVAAPRGPPAREFDASGSTSNEREIFAMSGFVQGSKVHTKTSISYTANASGGVRELAKGQHGHILSTDKDSISIEFDGRGLVTWRWGVFPGTSMAVKRPLEKASVVENVETPHKWPLHQTDAWQFLRAKAGMVQAIAAVAERVRLLKSYVMADNALPNLSTGVNLEVMLRPTRLVKAQTAIALEKPLLLLPLTCNIGIGLPTSNNFPSALNTLTDTNGKEMVISLSSCFVDPQKASAQKTAALEFFWLVRKNTILEKCNMKIINVQATAAVGVKFPDEPLRSVHSGSYLVPLMVSTQAIAEGDELVCYWGGGAPQSAAEALAETSLPQRAESSKKKKPA